MATELTPLEFIIERTYTAWDVSRYRDPVGAERFWAQLNEKVNQWCVENGYSFDEGWDELHRKLDLRPR